MNDEKKHKMAVALEQLLNRIHNYIRDALEKGQPFGACLVNPKHSLVPPPTKELKKEIVDFATSHFEDTTAAGYYLRYSTLPLSPVDPTRSPQDKTSIDDYLITLGHPQFDNQWQQTFISRALIFCMDENEAHGWDEWFELQHEAIRFTPLLHQSLNEVTLLHWIQAHLLAPAQPVFESFIYEYALTDEHVTISSTDREKWMNKQIPWESLYPLALNLLKPNMSLKEAYKLIHKKAASTRNQILKSLWNSFLQHIENKLFNHPTLPDEMKRQLIEELREPKKRPPKAIYNAKRAAVAISDIECAQVLYLLIAEFLKSKTKKTILAEAIIFIWIAQHAAFSGLSVTGTQIRSIKFKDIDFKELTIKISAKEMHTSGGLNEILRAYGTGTNPKHLLFQQLKPDNLEDIISRTSAKFYGEERKLLPKDFLEAVHVIPGARISIQLRNQLNKQAELAKNSPYRIKAADIKKDIKQAIRDKQPQA